MHVLASSENDNVEMGFSVGSLRVMAKVSDPYMLSGEEARAILNTLGPAVNQPDLLFLKTGSGDFSRIHQQSMSR